ncbi:hypothetical protein LINPERHAP1_LOCUS26277 [Linum perenne]
MLRNPIPYPQALKVGIKVLFALCQPNRLATRP